VPVVPQLEHVAPVAPLEARGWRPWITAALDLVFPPLCPVCDRLLGAGRRDPLCGECWVSLERIAPPWCRCCGVPLGIDGLCGACRSRRPRFAYARAALRYGDLAREAIHAFKFGGRRTLADPLGDLLAGLGLSALPGAAPDVLVPVPLHPRRARERGYNQALLLARRLERAWGVPVAADALRRAVATLPQADLDAAARRRNVRNAFAVHSPELVAGRHVVLVDDVLTTGATAGECAMSLKRAGAATVGVLTVARAL
jgi:ComF family protein